MQNPKEKLVNKPLELLSPDESGLLPDSSWGSYTKDNGWEGDVVFSGRVIREWIQKLIKSLITKVTNLENSFSGISNQVSNSINLMQELIEGTISNLREEVASSLETFLLDINTNIEELLNSVQESFSGITVSLSLSGTVVTTNLNFGSNTVSFETYAPAPGINLGENCIYFGGVSAEILNNNYSSISTSGNKITALSSGGAVSRTIPQYNYCYLLIPSGWRLSRAVTSNNETITSNFVDKPSTTVSSKNYSVKLISFVIPPVGLSVTLTFSRT